MDEYEQQYMQLMDKQLKNEQIKRMQMENEYGQQSSYKQDTSDIIRYQLDLGDELDHIFHLLSGHVLKINEQGHEVWEKPDDDRLRIFSEYGVKQIMNIIAFYINRNTLLSWYTDEEKIYEKIYNFSIELSDLIYNKYEEFFYYPTPEELYDKLKPIAIANGLNLTEEELYNKCIQWSDEELRKKLRHYPMICLALVDSVHSSFLRALRGETLKSLRTVTHISQNVDGRPDIPQPKQGWSPFRPKTWNQN